MLDPNPKASGERAISAPSDPIVDPTPSVRHRPRPQPADALRLITPDGGESSLPVPFPALAPARGLHAQEEPLSASGLVPHLMVPSRITAPTTAQPRGADSNKARTVHNFAREGAIRSAALATAASSPACRESTADYEVGRGKPPREHRFKKGQSGNPKGRPKGSKNFSTIFMELANTRRTVKIDGKAVKLTMTEIVAQQLFKKATVGDHRAMQSVLDYLDRNEMKDAASASRRSAREEEALDGSELALLRHRHREQLSLSGFDGQQIEAALRSMGLGEGDGRP